MAYQTSFQSAHQMHSYTEYGGQRSPTWLDRIKEHSTSNSQSYKKLSHEYFDGMRKRLQEKQEEAWERVRRQEEQIETRNARSLINFGRSTGLRSAYLSPTAHGSRYPYQQYHGL